jgi:hypothetical protein
LLKMDALRRGFICHLRNYWLDCVVT